MFLTYLAVLFAVVWTCYGLYHLLTTMSFGEFLMLVSDVTQVSVVLVACCTATFFGAADLLSVDYPTLYIQYEGSIADYFGVTSFFIPLHHILAFSIGTVVSMLVLGLFEYVRIINAQHATRQLKVKRFLRMASKPPSSNNTEPTRAKDE